MMKWPKQCPMSNPLSADAKELLRFCEAGNALGPPSFVAIDSLIRGLAADAAPGLELCHGLQAAQVNRP